MRPEKLRILGFGPFHEPQLIDFTGSGEFLLISGPTGAGKTTIFDAMMFALYGRLPGTRDMRSLVSDFLKEGTEPAVEFTFSAGGERFKVKRTPSYARASRRGGSRMVEVPTSVALFHAEEGQWSPESGNPTEINSIIAGRIGLSAEEFSRIVLLPQGEFQKFLMAETVEKRQILKTLFPADAHDRISELAKRLNNERHGELRTKNGELQRLQKEFDVGKYPEEMKRLTEGLDGAERNLKAARTGLEEINAEMIRAQGLLELFVEMETLDKQTKDLENEEEAVLDMGAGLSMARQAMTMKVPLDDLKRRRDEIAAEIKLAEKKKQELTACGIRMEILRKESISSKEKEEELARKRSELERLKILLPKEDALKELSSRLEKSSAALNTQDKKISEARLILEKKDTGMAILKSSVERAGELNSLLTRIVTDLASCRERASILERLDSLSGQKQTAEKDNSGLLEREKEIRASLAINMENERRLRALKESSLAAGLALKLQPGRPCPVCGSPEHPEPADRKAKPFTEEDLLRTAGESVMDFHEKLSRNLEGQSRCRELIERIDGEMRELKIEQGDPLAAVKIRIKDLSGKKETLEKQLLSMKEDRERLQKMEAETLALRTRLEKELESRSSVMAENAGLQKQISLLKEDLGDARDLAAMISRLENDISAGAKALETLAESMTETSKTLEGLKQSIAVIEERLAQMKTGLGKAMAEMDGLLSASPFQSIEECLESLISAEEMKSLEEKITAHENRKRELRVRQATVLERISGSEKPDMKLLEETRKSGQEAGEKLEEERNAIMMRMRDLERLRTAHETLSGEIGALILETETLARLSADLNGSNPKNINFQNFVLGHYLREVTTHANERLLRMTEGRYSLMVNEDIIHGSRQTGLELDVFDSFSGQRRSVRTLSGGEKFLASISLSLGLADAIQSRSGAMELDAIFIDEGFGSLDEEALDRALTILDEIRGNRLVGIISHVAELRTRIPSQIRVIKGSDGSRIEERW
jgi:exonuclease SbcC